MRRITAMGVHAIKVAELGLDPTALDLISVEAIAGAIRRSAGIMCPCTTQTLIRSIVQPLRGLVDDINTVKVLTEETLEAMIAHGDLIEYRDIEGNIGQSIVTLLYAAPPSFVTRESGMVILLGIASDQLSALPNKLEKRIEYVNYIRKLTPKSGEELNTELRQHGIVELSYNDWIQTPPSTTPIQYINYINELLDNVHPSREVPGLLILDPDSSVRYYPGRWVEPSLHTGRFIARRSQSYGAPLWCYIQLREGNPECLFDLPVSGSRWRGCDEAWHLQMAIDAQRGKPQLFRIRPIQGGDKVLEFFSPVPMWARRRWDAIGEPVSASGCLFAYRLNEAEVKEEIRFAQEVLWLQELPLAIQK